MLRRHIGLSWISDFVISCNFFAYFKFCSDGGRVVGKIKQNELDCPDTAPFKKIIKTTRCQFIERYTCTLWRFCYRGVLCRTGLELIVCPFCFVSELEYIKNVYIWIKNSLFCGRIFCQAYLLMSKMLN